MVQQEKFLLLITLTYGYQPLSTDERWIHHLKEESPIRCSRAVSRWVNEAWRDALIASGVEGYTNVAQCPFQHSIYGPNDTANTHCSLCNKSFVNPYYLDRHMDRKHLLNVQLSEEYYGEDLPDGVVLYNTTAICIEQYCPIFDVCDRPPDSGDPVIYNDLSITFASPPSTRFSNLSNARPKYHWPRVSEGECNVTKLSDAYDLCLKLVENCLPIEEFGKGNIGMVENLCKALSNCTTYLMRRKYAGSSIHYTAVAYGGMRHRPLSAWHSHELLLLIFTIVIGISCIWLFFATTFYHHPKRHCITEQSNLRTPTVRRSQGFKG